MTSASSRPPSAPVGADSEAAVAVEMDPPVVAEAMVDSAAAVAVERDPPVAVVTDPAEQPEERLSTRTTPQPSPA